MNPRKADWPQADFVIGNPPFIGNKRMRLALGDGYVEALRKTWSEVPETVDFVMYWWHRSAQLAVAGDILRFGLITTNSITQSFNRQVVSTATQKGLILGFAIPDHPWVDGEDGADVRVAMTVGSTRTEHGTLLTVSEEEATGDEAGRLKFHSATGLIHPDLKTGTNVSSAATLRANENLSFMGVTLVGQGFVVDPSDPLVASEPSALRKYLVGNELNRKPRNRFVIDFFGLSDQEAKARFPGCYQRLLNRVKPERDTSSRPMYRNQWWLFGEKRPKMRQALKDLDRYIVICRTAKHRVFTFVGADTLVESTIIAIALNDAFHLGVLSSRPHVIWSLRIGTQLGVGNDPRYNNSVCFETFPFPSGTHAQRSRIGEIADRLDNHRKRQLASYPELILTDVYNVVDKLRSGEPLSPEERDVHDKALASVLLDIHDELDAAVFDAYGWGSSCSDDEILERLLILNAAQASEETQGIVRWLRPETQNPAGHRAATQTTLIEEADEPADTSPAKRAKLPWPKTLPERAQAVRSALSSQKAPLTADQLAKLFLRANVDKVEELLDTLASLGQARELPDGRFVAIGAPR